MTHARSVIPNLTGGLPGVHRSRGTNRTSHGYVPTPDPRGFVEKVRGYDFCAHSDADLKRSLLELEGPAERGDIAARVFAVIAETIDRRLGAWSLFGPSSQGSLACFAHPTARQGRDALLIHDVMDRVYEERKFRRPSSICLPASFYKALRCCDWEGRYRFRVTDQQLLAGLHLFHGRVVQMNAGEGKTVAAAFSAVLQAMLGHSVHVITANDYLAARDTETLSPVYESLGFSVGAILSHMDDDERRHAYRSRIVYGTMRELGFDYLRDNLKVSPDERVQGKLEVAIIDEVDHALIDEAFTPMIISGQPSGIQLPVTKVKRAVEALIASQSAVADSLAERVSRQNIEARERTELMARLGLAQPEHPTLMRLIASMPQESKRVRALAETDQSGLTAGLLYAIDPDRRFVTLTEDGWEFLENRLGRIYDRMPPLIPELVPGEGNHASVAERRDRDTRLSRRLFRQHALGNYVYQSLRAYLLLRRDVDYLVDDDGIVLVDEHTGRPKPDSVYQFNLHSALETKEGLVPRPDFETLGQVSVAGFTGLYEHTSGMTGTAEVAVDEFAQKYGMEVAVVPPSNPMLRVDLGPTVYLTKEDKLEALVDDVAFRHRVGQPVLLGTSTVQQSEELSTLLGGRRIPHNLLNAVTTHTEEQSIKHAGRFGAVTVATNMAGRGTDILLDPGLNARIARRYVDLVRDMLADGSSHVDVSCHSTGQAQVLCEQLDLASGLDAVWTGLEVRIAPTGGNGAITEIGKLKFSLGLCVTGCDMQESARVHLQLNGRSGRQGAFGESQSFLSLEDRIINIRAGEVLKLSRGRDTDNAGREYFSGKSVSRLLDCLRRDAEREGQAQRGLLQDYHAVLDRHTELFYGRRDEIIHDLDMRDFCCRVVREVASDLVAENFSRMTHHQYGARFDQFVEQVHLDYGVDCSELYGCGLDVLPEDLAVLLTGRIDRLTEEAGARTFTQTARFLYLQTCDELWPDHLRRLRDSMSNHILGALYHKSNVAAFVRLSYAEWEEFWREANREFLVRLAAFPFPTQPPERQQPAPVSEQIEMLLTELPMPGKLTGASARRD